MNVTDRTLAELYRARDNANRRILAILTRIGGYRAAQVEAAEIVRMNAVSRYGDHPSTIAARQRALLEDDARWHDNAPKRRKKAAA